MTEKKKSPKSKGLPLYRFMQALVWIFLVPFFRIRRVNRERIPKDGAFLLVGNHINMLDPIVVSCLSSRHFRFMAKKELFDNFFLRLIINGVGGYPINRGEADLSGVRLTLSILKEGGSPLIFPEGTRNPNKGGVMLPLRDGVAMLALKGNAPVIPFFIGGAYNLFKGLTITVGEPVNLSDLDSRRVDKETLAIATARIRAAIHRAGDIEEGRGNEETGERASGGPLS